MIKVFYSPIGCSQNMVIKPKSKLTRLDYFYGAFLIWVAVTTSNILIVFLIIWF